MSLRTLLSVMSSDVALVDAAGERSGIFRNHPERRAQRKQVMTMYDMGPVREAERARAVAEAERRLEIELVEDKLAAIGARPMRPYEHHNEDEAYFQWMEEGRFGHYSR